MAFIWVQYYGFGPLPTIFESPMGDVPASSSPSEQIGQHRQDLEPSNSPYKQAQLLSQQQRRTSSNPSPNMAQTAMPFNMAALGGALPNLPYAQSFNQQPQHPQQQFPSAVSTPAVAYHLGQTSQFGGQQAMNQSSNPGYNMQYPQFQGVYPQHIPQPSLQTMQQGSPQNQHYFSNPAFLANQHPQQAAQFFYPPAQYAPQGQGYQMSQQQQYNPSGIPQHSPAHSMRRNSEHLNISTSGSAAGRSSSSGTPGSISPSVPRGPPRKPKQSGNALWVGNLPSGARVEDLKDHFSRDATDDIESVFLISKSNCAFVNYKTEASCAAAMARFHESRFQNVRLVCRLRRQSPSPAAVAGVPTGPAALTSTQPALAKTPVAGGSTSSQTEVTGQTANVNSDGVEASTARDKYFIVKSLTMEDLEMSVRNNIWATQSHNEEALNKAYEAADHVYLIFSANKSGEYFGYARMASPINDDPAAAIEFAPKAQLVDDPDLPKAIPTPATEFAPKGRIIDDSARGTIFWEAEIPEIEVDGVDGVEDADAQSQKSDKEGDPESATEASKAWGKPFKLEWLSTTRVPFYRTRGLRNPWNSNREVKIARDGTELETSVGRRLVHMFHRTNSPVGPPGMQPMLGPGYPQMRYQ